MFTFNLGRFYAKNKHNLTKIPKHHLQTKIQQRNEFKKVYTYT